MKSLSSRVRTAALAAAVVAAGILGAPTSSRAQGAIDADARSVLGAMSTYLGRLRNFSVAYAAVDEVVTTEGQKLQFLHAGELMVQHPDRLRALQQLYMVEATRYGVLPMDNSTLPRLIE